MADKTNIEWTEATWNPIAGCSIVSPGCTNCYAMRRVAPRLSANPATPHYAGTVQASKAGPVWTGKIGIARDEVLLEPLRWKKPKMIFVCAHGDLFHESVPDGWIDQVFAVMALCPHHTFQVLTKRPDRMRDYIGELRDGRRVYELACDLVLEHGINVILIPHPMFEQVAPPGRRVRLGVWPLPNVWLGTSVEDQRRADERIPHLLATPAPIRFLSAEPLLGPIDLGDTPWPPGWARPQDDISVGIHPLRYVGPQGSPIDWVIVGGESGNGARPMHPDWARSLRDQCQAAGVPFFFKQWGNWAPTGIWYADHAVSLPLRVWDGAGWSDDGSIPGEWLANIGKKAAGRLLDGVEHSAMPERR